MNSAFMEKYGSSGLPDGLLDRMIGKRVQDLVMSGHRNGFLPADADDLRQELTMEIVVRLADFDPTRGRIEGFVMVILDHKSASLLAHRRAARRNPRRCTRSLDELVRRQDGEVICLGDTIEDRAGRRHVDFRN